MTVVHSMSTCQHYQHLLSTTIIIQLDWWCVCGLGWAGHCLSKHQGLGISEMTVSTNDDIIHTLAPDWLHHHQPSDQWILHCSTLSSNNSPMSPHVVSSYLTVKWMSVTNVLSQVCSRSVTPTPWRTENTSLTGLRVTLTPSWASTAMASSTSQPGCVSRWVGIGRIY